MVYDFSKIKLVVCDFDGVMTDNSVIVDENGIEAVVCNRSDSLGIEMVKKEGIDVMVLSKEKNKVVKARCEKLRIPVIHGVDEKIGLFREEIQRRNLDYSQVCYIGNDVNDKECLMAAGIGVVVADAHPDVLRVADYVTTNRGGNGAVREVCDLILKGD